MCVGFVSDCRLNFNFFVYVCFRMTNPDDVRGM